MKILASLILLLTNILPAQEIVFHNPTALMPVWYNGRPGVVAVWVTPQPAPLFSSRKGESSYLQPHIEGVAIYNAIPGLNTFDLRPAMPIAEDPILLSMPAAGFGLSAWFPSTRITVPYWEEQQVSWALTTCPIYLPCGAVAPLSTWILFTYEVKR